MTTARNIIILALKEAGVIGVGQTPLAEDVNDSLVILNGMLSQWQVRRWLVPSLSDVSLTATGATSYTVGATGDFNILRPDRIEGAYVRQTVPSQPNEIDYPLSLISAYEDYSRIALKSLNSFPSYAFYDAAYPLGNLFIWPVPSSLYEIHILVKSTLSKFPTLDTEMALPDEYYEAIHYSLAVRLRPMYQLPPDPTLSVLASAAMATIRGSNAQIPKLRMPANLTRGNLYNVYSDQVY